MERRADWRTDRGRRDESVQGAWSVVSVGAWVQRADSWAQGWMHNRLRMIVASYLTKNLLVDWRLGEKYFMETLIDGEHTANNGYVCISHILERS